MLGKENYVKQNADKLKYTKYFDVEAKAWYAPYVDSAIQQYSCRQPDGSFAPLENVSEKAFHQDGACAIGYEYGTDFDWTNVYQKAYEVGIVIGDAYASKIQDNMIIKEEKPWK